MTTFSLASIANQRTKSDLERDLSSKPNQVLEFAGIKQGDKVLDFLGGGGYYSQIIKQSVGEDGSVVLHTNQAYLSFVGEALKKRAALKSGGKLLIIDHASLPERGIQDVKSLHRIDENYVKKDLETRGFKFVKQSDILRNPADAKDTSVFSNENKHKTDRFIQLYIKL